MRLYTIHVRHHGLDPDRDIVLVKEGFSWPAFFLTVLWAVWKGLWGTALAILGIYLAASALAYALEPDPVSEAVLGVALAVIIGLIANDARRRKLARDGYAFEGVLAAKDLESAEFEYLRAAGANP